MEGRKKKKTPIYQYMRSLHRDIGFLVMGLAVIYSLSGIVLIYRDTSFLKYETTFEQTLSPNLTTEELGRTLKMKELRVLREEGEIVHFDNGTYNKTTGVTEYSSQELPFVLSKFESLHKSSSKDSTYWFTTIFGILFFFLAISSLWMYKPSTRMFKRGVYLSIAGVSAAVILLVL